MEPIRATDATVDVARDTSHHRQHNQNYNIKPDVTTNPDISDDNNNKCRGAKRHVLD